MRFSYFILCRYLIIQNPKQISESQYYERLSVKIFSHSCFCFTLCFFALFSSNLSVFICFKSFSSSPPSFAGAGLKTLSLRRLTTRGFLAPLPVVPLQPAATEHSVSTYPSQRATWPSSLTTTHSPPTTLSMMITLLSAVLTHVGRAHLKSGSPFLLPTQQGQGSSGQCLVAFMEDSMVMRYQGDRLL